MIGLPDFAGKFPLLNTWSHLPPRSSTRAQVVLDQKRFTEVKAENLVALTAAGAMRLTTVAGFLEQGALGGKLAEPTRGLFERWISPPRPFHGKGLRSRDCCFHGGEASIWCYKGGGVTALL